MVIIESRFDVRLISAQVLVNYMEFRDLTVRQLAAKVGCSHSLIGFLRSGKRDTCQPATAKRIEKALNAPPGSLFIAKVSRVSREVGRTAA